MIHLEFVNRRESPQTLPVVCMHCDSPTCAEVCPADAIKRTEDGVVQTARKPRCIACNNCVLACPFGVPKMNTRLRADDEVRHVLRPHVGRARDRCVRPSARARRSFSGRARKSTACGHDRGRSMSFVSGADDSHEGSHDGPPRGDRIAHRRGGRHVRK